MSYTPNSCLHQGRGQAAKDNCQGLISEVEGKLLGMRLEAKWPQCDLESTQKASSRHVGDGVSRRGQLRWEDPHLMWAAPSPRLELKGTPRD